MAMLKKELYFFTASLNDFAILLNYVVGWHSRSFLKQIYCNSCKKFGSFSPKFLARNRYIVEREHNVMTHPTIVLGGNLEVGAQCPKLLNDLTGKLTGNSCCY